MGAVSGIINSLIIQKCINSRASKLNLGRNSEVMKRAIAAEKSSPLLICQLTSIN